MVKETIHGKDYETLSHELYDTMERESDLREQLKFSEDEAKQSRRKIIALEQENETLMMQIKKLTTVVRGRIGSRKGMVLCALRTFENFYSSLKQLICYEFS